MVADVALKRKAKGLKLNYPEAVGVISAVALDGARAGKTIEDVTSDARAALTKADVMEGVADLHSDGTGRGGLHRWEPARNGPYANSVKRLKGR